MTARAVIRYLKCFYSSACSVCTHSQTRTHSHTHRHIIYKSVCKSENVFRKRTGNLINTVCMLARGPKCRVAADTARKVPRELAAASGRAIWSICFVKEKKKNTSGWCAPRGNRCH